MTPLTPAPPPVVKGNRALCGLAFFLFFTIILSYVALSDLRVQATYYSSSPYEIRLSDTALQRGEGVGAVLSGLKPVLLLSNNTGAVITGPNHRSDHGYYLDKYLPLQKPLQGDRVFCNLSKSVNTILRDIVAQCQNFDYDELRSYGVFDHCDTLTVEKYLNHPRSCVEFSQDLVRSFTKFKLDVNAEKNDVCVLRRGGDVETKILRGQGNMWAIDEAKTLPILKQVSSRGKRIILVTETKLRHLKEKYHADVFSNRQPLSKAIPLLSTCYCLFISSGSSFAATVVQIVQPTIIIHTASRPGFEYSVANYAYSEYPNAVSILNGTERITDLCAPP